MIRSTVRMVLCAALCMCLMPTAAFGHARGTNGWYFPTGTEALGGMGGWMQYRSWNHSWHLAKDIGTRCGRPVYAVTDGVVYDAYTNLRGYGGVMVVLHRQEDGTYFKALYGHIKALKYRKGQRVKAGAIIAYVNNTSPNHLHFSIHPGAGKPTDPQHNVFRGHTYVKKATYGWTDPVAYLYAHSTYPPLPPVTITRPDVPTETVAAAPMSVSASMTPVHAGPGLVTLQVWKLNGLAWTYHSTQAVSAVGTDSVRTTVRLPAGSWRMCVRFKGDSSHGTTTSPVAFTLSR
ncbi:MAG: M23 family metallopeptidase [Coriobacteriia bacterium]|nr:M23 family metallopeptidase [Coriobacteriia bacterium]